MLVATPRIFLSWKTHPWALSSPSRRRVGCDTYPSKIWHRGVSQPTLQREGDARLTGASSKKGKCAESPPTFIWGKRQKNRKVWSTNFKCERFKSCFYARGRYKHPTHPSQGTAAFNQVCKYDFKMFYFPFFMSFYAFCIFYLFVVDKGVSLAPTYSSIVIRKLDLRSSFKN